MLWNNPHGFTRFLEPKIFLVCPTKAKLLVCQVRFASPGQSALFQIAVLLFLQLLKQKENDKRMTYHDKSCVYWMLQIPNADDNAGKQINKLGISRIFEDTMPITAQWTILLHYWNCRKFSKIFSDEYGNATSMVQLAIWYLLRYMQRRYKCWFVICCCGWCVVIFAPWLVPIIVCWAPQRHFRATRFHKIPTHLPVCQASAWWPELYDRKPHSSSTKLRPQQTHISHQLDTIGLSTSRSRLSR